MNDIRNQFQYIKNELSLTSEERRSVRALLQAHVAVGARAVPSPFFALFAHPAAFAFVALLLVSGGGVTYASAHALPGDVLYGVKVGVTERIERAVAVTPIAKASVNIRHAEERLREVELLVARGTIDTRSADDIKEDIVTPITQAATLAAELSAGGDAAAADAISANIQSALSAHADILDAQAEDLPEEEGRKLKALSVALAITADDIDAAEFEEVPQESVSVVVAHREERVRARIETLREALADEKTPSETREELSLELAEIEASFGEARGYIAEADYGRAENAYERIDRRTYRAITLLSSAQRMSAATGKEVVIDLDAELQGTEPEATAPAADMMLMKAAVVENATLAEEATTSKKRIERGLRFFVRERVDTEIKE